MSNNSLKDNKQLPLDFEIKEEMRLSIEEEEAFWKRLRDSINFVMNEGCSLIEAKAFVLSFLDTKDANKSQAVKIGEYNSITKTANVLLADASIHAMEFFDYSSYSDYEYDKCHMPEKVQKAIKKFFINLYQEKCGHVNLRYFKMLQLEEVCKSNIPIYPKIRKMFLQSDIDILDNCINIQTKIGLKRMKALNLNAYEEYLNKEGISVNKKNTVKFLKGDTVLLSELRATVEELRLLAKEQGKEVEAATEKYIQARFKVYKKSKENGAMQEGTEESYFSTPIVKFFTEMLDLYYDYFLPINGQGVQSKEVKKVEEIVGKSIVEETNKPKVKRIKKEVKSIPTVKELLLS